MNGTSAFSLKFVWVITVLQPEQKKEIIRINMRPVFMMIELPSNVLS